MTRCKSTLLFLLFIGNCCLLRSALADPALWLVQSADGKGGQAYLFGSVHFGTDGMYPLSAEVMEAFTDSEILAVELDINPLDDAAVGQQLMQYGRYPAGVSLAGQLPQSHWQQLVAVARQQGITPQGLTGLKPWLVAFMLVTSHIRQSGFSELLGVDHYFLRRAHNSPEKMSVLALETVEQQLAIFSEMSDERQMDFLLQTLEEFRGGPEVLATIIKAWSDGDEAALEQHMFGGMAGAGSPLQDMLYRQRNQVMLEKLMLLLEQRKNLFVVVGAGHIVGDQGLRALFERQGYQLSRVQ